MDENQPLLGDTQRIYREEKPHKGVLIAGSFWDIGTIELSWGDYTEVLHRVGGLDQDSVNIDLATQEFITKAMVVSINGEEPRWGDMEGIFFAKLMHWTMAVFLEAKGKNYSGASPT